jgi:Tol biopolymer transport system component
MFICIGAVILLAEGFGSSGIAQFYNERQTAVQAKAIERQENVLRTQTAYARTQTARERTNIAESRVQARTATAEARRQAANNPVPTGTNLPTRTSQPSSTERPRPSQTAVPTFTNTSTPSGRFLYSGMIVYCYGVDSQREVHLLDPRTMRDQQVTSNNWREEGPSFSPDNSRLVYASYREEGWELFVRDMQTGIEKQITHFNGQARWPEWSPAMEDERIVFEGRNDAGQGFIYMINADGSGMEQLTTGGSESSPSWSPDGAQVVHGHSMRDTNGDGIVTASDSEDVYITSIHTQETRAFTDTPSVDEFLYVWSPDGRWIAVSEVSGDRDGNRFVNLDDARDIRLIAVDGSENRMLDTGDLSVFSPDWSPNGLEIVLTADVGNQTEIWIYSLETGQSRRITETGPYYHTEWAN